MSPRRYEPCGFVTQVYPAWSTCGKPVPVSLPIPRCPEHMARLPYWPGAEPVGFPVHSCEPENPCPVLAGAECEGSDPAKWSRGALPEVVTADGQGDLFAGQ